MERAIKMVTAFAEQSTQRLKMYIKEQPSMPIRYKGIAIQGKWVKEAYIVVKVCRNLWIEGFMNGDICEVLADFDNGNAWIKRLSDNYEEIVAKKYLKIPVWDAYESQV